MSNQADRPVLLVVEDSPEDFELIRRGLARTGFDLELQRCIDGDDALDYLHGADGGRHAPRPALILLDLNLPGTDGREVLAEIKRHETLATIPIVVFSNSGNSNDVNACYALGANSFVEKPLGPAAFADVMSQLCRYWLQLVRLPDYDAPKGYM